MTKAELEVLYARVVGALDEEFRQRGWMPPVLPQSPNKFSVNKYDEMRQLAEYLEQYRLSDPHLGKDDCDLIADVLRAVCADTRPLQTSGEANEQ